MKYRVYYSDNVYTASTIESDNSKEAAKMYFRLNPRDYDCNISVEEKGIGNKGFNKYHISEFNSLISKPSENHKMVPPASPNIEKRFHTALGVSKYLTTIGWLNIIIAATLLVIGIISINTEGVGFIGIAFASYVSGIIILVLGELIQTILAIEENTRTTNVLLNKVTSKSILITDPL